LTIPSSRQQEIKNVNVILTKTLSGVFTIFSCCTKSGDQSPEGLTKSNYRTYREVKNLGIQYVGQPLDFTN
jgi:hypothetical protein